MSSKVMDPAFDATSDEVSKLPPFVRIPTGEIEMTDDGEPQLDEDGRPVEVSTVYLVRRTGETLKKIFRLETDTNHQIQKQIREEEEWWKREEREEADESIPADKKYKVDLDELGSRRSARAEMEVDSAYEALSYLLVDPKTGSHPDPAVLTNTLDFVVVRDWMNKFVPRPEVTEEGEIAETPTDAGSETDPGASS